MSRPCTRATWPGGAPRSSRWPTPTSSALCSCAQDPKLRARTMSLLGLHAAQPGLLPPQLRLAFPSQIQHGCSPRRGSPQDLPVPACHDGEQDASTGNAAPQHTCHRSGWGCTGSTLAYSHLKCASPSRPAVHTCSDRTVQRLHGAGKEEDSSWAMLRPCTRCGSVLSYPQLTLAYSQLKCVHIQGQVAADCVGPNLAGPCSLLHGALQGMAGVAGAVALRREQCASCGLEQGVVRRKRQEIEVAVKQTGSKAACTSLVAAFRGHQGATVGQVKVRWSRWRTYPPPLPPPGTAEGLLQCHHHTSSLLSLGQQTGLLQCHQHTSSPTSHRCKAGKPRLGPTGGQLMVV